MNTRNREAGRRSEEISGMGWLDTTLKWCVLSVIWVYRTFISPIKPPTCRFTPTCSVYAWQAVRRFGAIRGGWLALCRLLRCHPFYRGPLVDPVPLAGQDTKKAVASDRHKRKMNG